MTVIKKLTKRLKRMQVDPRLLICFECGSDQVILKEKTLSCNNCGIKRKFKKLQKSSNFAEGEIVRIIEYNKPSEQVFKIRRVKETKNGIEYLLKSDESDITLLYHESINSHLEKAN